MKVYVDTEETSFKNSNKQRKVKVIETSLDSVDQIECQFLTRVGINNL